MQPLINIATTAARNASRIIIRSLDRLDTIKISEKHHNDFVTEIDQQSEQEIIATIRKSYPDHAIWGEEGGQSGKSDYTWIIDPIDGTTNFLHGHPHFSISIGIQYKDKIEHGLIYDPLRQELFTATRGGGAFLNDRRIRVGTRKSLTGSLIATGFNSKTIGYLPQYLKILSKLLPEAAGVRRSGSAALDFAYVAAGRVDGFWEFTLSPWDMAAGLLLVKEAGGWVTDFDEKENYFSTGNVIAANQKIHKLLLQIIQETRSSKESS